MEHPSTTASSSRCMLGSESLQWCSLAEAFSTPSFRDALSYIGQSKECAAACRMQPAKKGIMCISPPVHVATYFVQRKIFDFPPNPFLLWRAKCVSRSIVELRIKFFQQMFFFRKTYHSISENSKLFLEATKLSEGNLAVIS